MDMRPSDNLERMRSLLVRMEHAVDEARDRRHGVEPATAGQVPTPSTNGGVTMQSPASDPFRQGELTRGPLPFPTVSVSGKPKARAKTLDEFDAAFKRLAERQAG